MRRLSMVLACAAGVFASQDCLAGGQRFDLGRRNTTILQFQQDRDDCVTKVIRDSARHSSRAARRHACQVSPNPMPPVPGGGDEGYQRFMENIYRPSQTNGPPYGGGYSKYDVADDRFLECMRARGYYKVPESWGFRCGPLWK